jgi:hypothetical protein
MIAALGLAGWAVLRPTPKQSAMTSSSVSSSPAAPQEANYTDAQRTAAKTQICADWNVVKNGVNLNTNLTAPGGPNDTTGTYAIAANARLALIGGGQYLLTRLDPATPPDLADAIRKFANNLMEIGVNATAGTQNSDPAQAARLKETDQLDSSIKGLCN